MIATTPNAFTLPATGIQIRQQSAKQIKQNATRVNRFDPACTKTDLVKQWKLEKASI